MGTSTARRRADLLGRGSSARWRLHQLRDRQHLVGVDEVVRTRNIVHICDPQPTYPEPDIDFRQGVNSRVRLKLRLGRAASSAGGTSITDASASLPVRTHTLVGKQGDKIIPRPEGIEGSPLIAMGVPPRARARAVTPARVARLDIGTDRVIAPYSPGVTL